jgi:hypothetical protein
MQEENIKIRSNECNRKKESAFDRRQEVFGTELQHTFCASY